MKSFLYPNRLVFRGVPEFHSAFSEAPDLSRQEVQQDPSVGATLEKNRDGVRGAVEGVYGKGDKVLAQLKKLLDYGALDSKEYPYYLKTLQRLKPECWQDLRFISHTMPGKLGGYYEGFLGLNIIGLDKNTPKEVFVHEIAHHAWRTMVATEDQEAVKASFKSLSKDERVNSQYRVHGLFPGSAQEWFCNAFPTWLYRIEPGYNNITTNPKIAPVLKVFKSLVHGSSSGGNM